MQCDEAGLHYRPGYNPAFVARVRKKRLEERTKALSVVNKERREKARAERIAAFVAEKKERERAVREKEAARQSQASAASRALEIREKVAAAAASGISYRNKIKQIEDRAYIIFGVTRQELRGNRRNSDIVFARHFVMYWASRLTPFSMPQIGRLMGGRDHTTILSGRKSYVNRRRAMGRHLREAR